LLSGVLVKRAPVRVESEQSLRVREAIVPVIDGIARAKDVPLRRRLDGGITEATADELAEHVRETVELRLSRPLPLSR
jgi:hypothetical protein